MLSAAKHLALLFVGGKSAERDSSLRSAALRMTAWQAGYMGLAAKGWDGPKSSGSHCSLEHFAKASRHDQVLR
jgi:hypothetical protein